MGTLSLLVAAAILVLPWCADGRMTHRPRHNRNGVMRRQLKSGTNGTYQPFDCTICLDFLYDANNPDYMWNITEISGRLNVKDFYDYLNPAKKMIYMFKLTPEVIKIRPYLSGDAKNPKPATKRSSVWIEAGFEAYHYQSVAVALNIAERLMDACQDKCQYDYFFVPFVNYDYDYAMNQSLSHKNDVHNAIYDNTRDGIHKLRTTYDNTYSKGNCSGINLLNNFNTSAWHEADEDGQCSGLHPFEHAYLDYVHGVKQDDIDNIGMTIVLSGYNGQLSEVGHGPTFNPPMIDTKTSMEDREFEKKLHNVGTGNYAASMDAIQATLNTLPKQTYTWQVSQWMTHRDLFGHPTDYYYENYPNAASYNIAFDLNTLGPQYVDEMAIQALAAINAAITYWEGHNVMRFEQA